MPFILLMVLLLMSIPLLHGAAVAFVTVGKIAAVLACIALVIGTLFLLVKLFRSARELWRELGK